MNGIVLNLDPMLFHLGPFAVGWYGLAMALAVVAAVFVATREAARRGISPDAIYSLVMWAVPAGFLGARLFHVVDRLDYYLANPGALLAFQQGGLAIWGGVGGGVLAGVLYARAQGLPLARLADVAALALLTGQIVGRLGCIVNGDAYGGPTTLPWGFIYSHPMSFIPQELRGIPTHPYPVYEMLWNLSILGLLWGLRKRFPTDGLLFASYLFLYSLGRFLLTFVRQEEIWFWGLQEAQVLALLGVFGAIALSLALLHRKGDTPKPEPQPSRSG